MITLNKAIKTLERSVTCYPRYGNPVIAEATAVAVEAAKRLRSNRIDYNTPARQLLPGEKGDKREKDTWQLR